MPDKYEVRTQYTPALLCSVPFIAIGIYFIGGIDAGFWSSVLGQTAGGISMTVALYYFAAFICRHVGKWIEERVSKNGLYFPTTDYLIEDSKICTPERQSEIIKKINNEFGIDLSSRQADSESNRRRIHEAIGAIRKKFFQKSDPILLRNIQFGFSKNLAGGALVAALTALCLAIGSVLTQNTVSFKVSIVLFLIYVVLTIFGLMAMKSNGIRYAHTLFDEYLAS